MRNILILPFILISFLAQSKIGKYPVKNFTPLEYKAGIQNNYFAQNRDKTLFVANNLGILTFNGTRWTIQAKDTGKKQRSLAFDPEVERLYVGSQGDFGYYTKNWEYVSLAQSLNPENKNFDEVWDVFLFNSNVYFCTFQGIFIYDGTYISRIDSNLNFNKSFITGNRLFTQTSTGKLFEIIQHKLVDNIEQSINNEIVAGILNYSQGILIFYNSGKIELASSLGSKSIYNDLQAELKGTYVNHVMRLSDSRIVISTQRSGLIIYDESLNFIKKISQADGLLSNACLTSFQDKTGGLWVGMQNGIAVVDINSPQRLVNTEINLKGSGYDVYFSTEGTYYTTSNGIFFKGVNDNNSIFLDNTEGPSYSISLINDRLYASHHTGLFLLEGGNAIKQADIEGLWNVKRLNSNPNYAIGGGYSGLHIFEFSNNGLLQYVKKLDEFNESSRFFEEDRQGNIWVGQFYKGLFKVSLDENLNQSTITHVSESHPDKPIQEHIILCSIDEEIYIGTEKGVYILNQIDESITYSSNFNDKIGEDWIYLMNQDKKKNVHVYSEQHVGFYQKIGPDNYVFVPTSLFQLRQLFNNDLLNVSINVPEGVFFNANEGFIYYRPDLEDNLRIEKPPVVTKVYNSTQDIVLYNQSDLDPRIKQTDPVIADESLRVFQFTVESFKFKDLNNQQFRYFLKGFDKDYSEWTSTDTKEYTNLKASTYEFYVQSVNSLGEIVTSEPLVIKIRPTFLNSPMAKTIYFILAIVILYQIYRLQRGYYRSKTSKITKAQEEEINRKQNEVQRLRDAQNESELRHLNNLLAASTMNLVVKNEFMENIKEEIKQVKNNEQGADTKKALTKIVKEIDTTLKVQEDWKQFEHHFDRVHGDFLNRLTSEFIDLTPGEQKLCAFLRLKMDTKEIANLMGISLRGVEVARYRLRKKLDLSTEQNLSKFILEY